MNQSSDMQSVVDDDEVPVKQAPKDAITSDVTLASRASTALDGAGRAKNGRETHGLERVKATIREASARGMKLLDGRTSGGRALAEWRDDLLTSLGGEESLSAQQLQVIDALVPMKLMLGHVDSYLLELGPKVVNRRKKQLVPVLQQRMAIADSMLKHLQALGLSRRAKPAEDLHQYMARKATKSGGTSVS